MVTNNLHLQITYMQRIIVQASFTKNKCDGINGVIEHSLEKIHVMALMV